MTLNEITYSETRQVSECAWIKIGLKASLDPTDNPDEALSIIKSKVSEYHNLPPIIPTNQVEKQEYKGNIIDDIRNCTGIEALETYKYLVRNSPGAIEIYNQQLNKLLNNK